MYRECTLTFPYFDFDRGSRAVKCDYIVLLVLVLRWVEIMESGYRVPAGTLLLQLLRDCATI